MATTANMPTTSMTGVADVAPIQNGKNGVEVDMATSTSPPPTTASTVKSSMDESKTTSITPTASSSSSNAKLASMLADALSQVESLKSALYAEQKRASYFESLSNSLQTVQPSPTSSSPSPHSEAVTQKVTELEKRAYEAELRLEREISRRHALVDQWSALSRYFDRIDAVTKDARTRMDRVVESGSPPEVNLMLHIPTIDEQTAYIPAGSSRSRRRRRSSSMERDFVGGEVYGPPSKRSRSDRQGAYHQYSSTSFDPEHPNQLYALSPHPQQAHSFPPPPQHVSRSHSGGRHHHHHVHHHGHGSAVPVPVQDTNAVNASVLPHPHGRQPQNNNHTQSSSRRQPRSQNMERSHSRTPSPSHSRSQSDGSSQSLDEMLLQATTGDSPQGLNGPGYPPQHLPVAKPGTISGRDRSHSHMGPPSTQGYPPPPAQYAQYSHPPPPAPPGYAHPNSSTAGSSLSPRSRYLSDSPPVSRRERDRGDPREYADYEYEYRTREGRDRTQSLTTPTSAEVPHPLAPQVTLREVEGRQPIPQAKPTHTFVPVQTGAPTKKARWSATGPTDGVAAMGGQGVGHSASLPSLSSHSTLNASSSSLHTNGSLQAASFGNSSGTDAPTSPFPATNASGQRICRQCGALGRYKEGKCVEKWGPGPMGPGTVCDRCRKKMKRVERRKALQAEAEMGEEESQSQSQPSQGLARTDTFVYTPAGDPATGAGRTSGKLVLPALSSLSTANSRSGSRAGSIVNGTTGSRKGSPSTTAAGTKSSLHLAPARMVQPSPNSSLATRKPVTANGRYNANSNGSSGSNRSNGSMDMDADGEADEEFEATQLVGTEGDGDADITDLVERQVEEELEMSKADEEEEDQVDGELADMVGEPERYGDRRIAGHHTILKHSSRAAYSKNDHEDIDVAVSQLAGMDDQDGDAEMEGDAESDLLEAVHAAEAKT